jgi:hypothetical protein
MAGHQCPQQLDSLRKAGEEAAELMADQDGQLIDREHRELSDEYERAGELQDRLANQLADAQLDISVKSSELRASRAEYDALWSARLQGHGHPSSHPLVTTTLATIAARCAALRGTRWAFRIAAVLERGHCPLCDAALGDDGRAEEADALQRLQELDAQIIRQQEALAAAEQAVARLAAARDRSRDEIAS